MHGLQSGVASLTTSCDGCYLQGVSFCTGVQAGSTTDITCKCLPSVHLKLLKQTQQASLACSCQARTAAPPVAFLSLHLGWHPRHKLSLPASASQLNNTHRCVLCHKAL